ncbi:MAG: hypothetical protein HY360_07350 [Verrucomicrobia bacterium]|nr:hypothetical protein [Verrucomicrobiota bacterium]
MSTLEIIVEELKTLPPAKLDQAASFIHRLRENGAADRRAALERAYGCLTEEEAGEMQKAIEANCERIDPREW